MSALCQNLALVIHTVSLHLNGTENNFNPGMGVECDMESEYVYQVGDYYNSYRKNSVYAVGGYDYWTGPISFGVFGGGVTGYRYTIAPVAGARIQYRAKFGNVGISLIPSGPREPASAHLMFSIPNDYTFILDLAILAGLITIVIRNYI